MGNSQPESQKFNELNWRRVGNPSGDVQLFENANDKNIHIEQHHIETISEEDFEKIKEYSYLRKNNPRWVSALYFEDTHGRSEFCATKYQADLYLENIPIRLCNIKSIPFPDALHLYDQALNGFCQFARHIGCFPVESDYMGINQRGVVKVWAGARWEQIGVKAGTISEEDMVKSIVLCLQERIDQNSLPPQIPSIANFLYRGSRRVNFETAITEFKNYAIATNMGSIPSRLNSIENTPGSYDIERRSLNHINQPRQLVQAPPPEVPRYYSPPAFTPPNHTPRYSVRREPQVAPEQVEAMRKVNSLSTFPVYSPPFVNHQELRSIGPAGTVTAVLRPSLSNPQLTSVPQLRPASSSRHMQRIQTVQVPSYPAPPSNRIYVNASEVRPPVNPLSGSRPNLLRDGSGVGIPIEQNRPLAITKQQQLSIIPPSQTQIPRQQQQSNLQIQTLPRREYNQGANNQQSIVLQLTKSQTNNSYNPVSSYDSKFFNQPRNVQNSNIVSQNRDYPATIFSESQSSLKSTPTGQSFQNKFFTPIGVNKKEISNLNSIEEVQTQHYWKDYSSKNSEARPEKNNAEPYSLSNLKENYKAETNDLAFNKKYNVIDSNDGKSSDDFLQKLKSFGSGVNINSYDNIPSTNYDFSSSKYDFTSTNNYDFGIKDYSSKINYDYKPATNIEYNYSFEKKKDVGLADTYNIGSTVKQSPNSFDYKSFEFKPASSSSQFAFDKATEFEDKYSTKYATGSSSMYTGIDPELLEDIQKNKE